MAATDFNRLMDDYIEKKRTSVVPSFLDSKKKQSAEEEIVPEDVSATSVYVIKKPKGFWKRMFDRFLVRTEEDFEAKQRKETTETVESEQEFEQEYDEMKHDEKRLTFFQWLKGLFAKDVEEEYQDIDDEEKMKETGHEGNESSAPKLQQDIEDGQVNVKKPLFSRFLELFGISVDVRHKAEEEFQEKAKEVPPSTEKMIEMKEDMKELAVISVATFKKLPKEHFELFKDSSDFKKFKEILKKYNVVK